MTTTQQTAAGGEYTVLLDYEVNMLNTMVDHTLGSRMIEMGWSDTVILVEPVPARHGEVVTEPGGKDDVMDKS